MAIKGYRPTSPAKRHMTVADFSQISDKKPEKRLLRTRKNHSGRNSYGRITVRHRGGGNRRKLRVIDWKRKRYGVPAKVVAIEYDPNRSAHIALIQYVDGDKAYILAPDGLTVGATVESGPGADVIVGNAMPLANIPVGTEIHNIELKPGAGAQIVRSAGASAQLMAKEDKYCQVRLPSGEVRMIPTKCMATIGRVGNIEHENIHVGKAGRKRHMGFRPSVRGLAMNPVDHPHGGGEGRSPIGMPSPLTPWGQPTLGKKTRKKNKPSDRLIVRRRRKS